MTSRAPETVEDMNDVAVAGGTEHAYLIDTGNPAAAADIATRALQHGVEAKALAREGRCEAAETLAREAVALLDKAGVVVTPGRGYGERGEGFFRISLTVPDARLDEALERIRKAFS